MSDGGRSLDDLARRLVALREALGYNQSAFAVHVELTQPALNNYERGLRRPDFDSAIKIKVKTGATLDWIYEGDRTGLPGRLLEILPDLSRTPEKAG